MRTRTSLIRLSPPRGAEPRSRRQSQGSQAAQRREALFSPISKYGVRTKRHEPSRRWSCCFLPRPECEQTHWQDGAGASEDGRLFRLQTRKRITQLILYLGLDLEEQIAVHVR